MPRSQAHPSPSRLRFHRIYRDAGCTWPFVNGKPVIKPGVADAIIETYRIHSSSDPVPACTPEAVMSYLQSATDRLVASDVPSMDDMIGVSMAAGVWVRLCNMRMRLMEPSSALRSACDRWMGHHGDEHPMASDVDRLFRHAITMSVSESLSYYHVYAPYHDLAGLMAIRDHHVIPLMNDRLVSCSDSTVRILSHAVLAGHTSRIRSHLFSTMAGETSSPCFARMARAHAQVDRQIYQSGASEDDPSSHDTSCALYQYAAMMLHASVSGRTTCGRLAAERHAIQAWRRGAGRAPLASAMVYMAVMDGVLTDQDALLSMRSDVISRITHAPDDQIIPIACLSQDLMPSLCVRRPAWMHDGPMIHVWMRGIMATASGMGSSDAAIHQADKALHDVIRIPYAHEGKTWMRDIDRGPDIPSVLYSMRTLSRNPAWKSTASPEQRSALRAWVTTWMEHPQMTPEGILALASWCHDLEA